MITLIVALISVVLVAAIAIATQYYGSDAMSQGADAARAVTLINQGLQLVSAAQAYQAETGSWPQSMQELLDKHYLNSLPVVGADASGFSVIPSAYAADAMWDMPTAGIPTFVLKSGFTRTVCQHVNKEAMGNNGIPEKAYNDTVAQCYGKANSALTVVVSVGSVHVGEALPPADMGLGHVPSVPSDGGWFVPPTVYGNDPSPFPGYLNATDPIDILPTLPPADWTPTTLQVGDVPDPGLAGVDTMCSPYQSTDSAYPAMEYAIVAPEVGVLSVSLHENLRVQAGTDYPSLGYWPIWNWGSGAPIVSVDGQTMPWEPDYNHWDITSDSAPNFSGTYYYRDVIVGRGTHLIRIQPAPQPQVYDMSNWSLLSTWPAGLPKPQVSACINKLQNSITLRPLNPVSVSSQPKVTNGTCEFGSSTYWSYLLSFPQQQAPSAPPPVVEAWHALRFQDLRVVGAKAAMDSLVAAGPTAGVMFQDGPDAGTAGMLASSEIYWGGTDGVNNWYWWDGYHSLYEGIYSYPLTVVDISALSAEPVTRNKAYRVSDTELWVPYTWTGLKRGNLCVGSGCDSFLTTYQASQYTPQATSILQTSLPEGPLYQYKSNIVAQAGSSSCSTSPNVDVGKPYRYAPSNCPVGFQETGGGACTCVPSNDMNHPVVCPTPNAALTGTIPNTNPSQIDCKFPYYFGYLYKVGCVPSGQVRAP